MKVKEVKREPCDPCDPEDLEPTGLHTLGVIGTKLTCAKCGASSWESGLVRTQEQESSRRPKAPMSVEEQIALTGSG